jgi:hypothetical protein
MMQTLPTPPANSTGGDESEYDVVAALNFADLGPNFFHYAGSLVAEHHWPRRYAPLAAHHVIVSAAQAYGSDAHQYLGGPGGSSVICSIDIGAPTSRNTAARQSINLLYT